MHLENIFFSFLKQDLHSKCKCRSGGGKVCMWGVNKWEHEKEGELSHCRQMFNRIHAGSNSGWVFMKIRQDSLSPKTELCFKSGS